MKCDICKKREATVHLTEIINDKVSKLHLCEKCAKEKGDQMQSHFGLTDLLSGLMDMGPVMGDEPLKVKASPKCDMCGMTYQDFQKKGKLGCGECYEKFNKPLSELLRKIHGSDRHVGKMPFKGEKTVKEQEDLKRLKDELNKMIQQEEFEKAAVLRDRIKELEEKMSGSSDDDESK